MEACLKASSEVQPRIIQNLLYAALVDSDVSFKPNSVLSDFFRSVDLLDTHIESIWVELDSLCAAQPVNQQLLFNQCRLHVHVYANNYGSWQLLGLPDEDADEDAQAEETSAPAASVLQLPEASLDGLWQNLIFDSGIKETLLTVGWLR